FYFLDVITYRSLSDNIAFETGVRHESPQVLVIQNEVCVYHESHTAIYMEDIVKHGMRA
ncbi:MAG TPA: monothiol bacilliredoxin BrxC family protein, partial [Agriterribacter sp.]|nr:monothiol bacilliredoxin BrxC family protein [Agriterribacter sp.]